MTIQRQEVGIMDKATNLGDGINGGVVGFRYPSLTSAREKVCVNCSSPPSEPRKSFDNLPFALPLFGAC
jgi:hypothetical protein